MIRVGTWNVENLFLPGGAAGPKTPEAYEAKIRSLAAVIRDHDPDVLAVQEVGSPEALDVLAAEVGGTWHVSLAEATDPDHPIRVGYLSRRPLTYVEQVTEFPPGLFPVKVDDVDPPVSVMGRPGLRARVRTGGPSIDLVTCHLKSKLLTFPGRQFSTHDEYLRARYAVYALNRRAAEAATIRERATQLLAGQGQERPLVVFGDLNDEPEAATTQMLLGAPGSEIGTLGFDRPDLDDGQRLWNVGVLIEPPEDRWTRMHNNVPLMIDHVLVSHVLVHLLRPGDVFTATTPDSINDDPNERRDEPGSDHRPIFVDIPL